MIKKINSKYFFIPCIAVVIMASIFFWETACVQSVGPGATFKSPIGADSVDSLLTSVMDTLKKIIASIAVLMIIVGGIIYMTSAGDQGRVDLAKKTVTGAVIGLVLVIAAPSILKEIYDALGYTEGGTPEGKSFFEIINSIISTLAALIGSIAVLMLLISGVMYMTSGGDDTRAETAKNTIKYAIVGLIIAILSWLIVEFVAKIF